MRSRDTIAIVGGGVSGALTAYHLVRHAVPARVVIIDPRSEAGLGLAYSTPSLQHLLNVPAGKISALPDQPDHFLHWLQRNHDPQMTAADFALRAIFGRYIQSLLATVPQIEHLRTSVTDCRIHGSQATLTLADGTELIANVVVLATGNFSPASLQGISEEAISSGAYRHSAWEDSTYTDLPNDAPVTLIGAGLTAIDVLLRLREKGHRGPVTAISRHGVFPQRHAPYEPLAECIIADTPPTKAHQLLRAVHRAIKAGHSWRAVVDSLRSRTNEFWLALPPAEQRRFRRHLLRRWEIVRHRMAPRIADQLEAELTNGTLVHHRGSLHAVLQNKKGAIVQFRSHSGEISSLTATRVINCTGPDMNYRRVNSPLLNSLFTQGLIVEGPLGNGLWSDSQGSLRAQDGTTSSILFNLGPGRLGTLLESIAIPELRQQAVSLAELLAARLSETASQQAIYLGDNGTQTGHVFAGSERLNGVA